MDTIPHTAFLVIEPYLAELRYRYGERILCCSLVGSIPLGDYRQGKSDVDIVTVLDTIGGGDIAALRSVHRAVRTARHNPPLNCLYMTGNDVSRTGAITRPMYHGGALRETVLELVAVTLRQMREYAIVLHGGCEVPEITADVLNAEMRRNMAQYWSRWARKHTSAVRPGGMLLYLFPVKTEWGVLGVSRQLATVADGRIFSKTAAGEFCLAVAPPEFHPILKEALRIRRSATLIKPGAERMRETIRYMRWAIDEVCNNSRAGGIFHPQAIAHNTQEPL